MMGKFNFLAFVFLMSGLVVFNSQAQRKNEVKVNVVKASTMNNAIENVVPYVLPKTVLRIEVEVERQINKVGPFFRYSEKFLNLSKTITADSETYHLKSLKITPVGKPNTDQTYLINMAGHGVAQNINVDESGIIYGINLPSMIKKEVVNTVSLQTLKASDVTFDGVPLLEKQLVKTSTAAMAEEAANYIYKLRKRKAKIFSLDFEKTPTPPDGESYQLIDNELDSLEAMFVELFAGKQVTEIVTKTFEFVPDLKGQDKVVLFRFSESEGVVDRMDLSGTPVYIEVSKLDEKPLPDGEVLKSQKSKSTGLYICKPGLSLVKVIDKNKTIVEQEMPIAQFGQVISLPSSVLERDNATIELSPVTGALLRIGQSLEK